MVVVKKYYCGTFVGVSGDDWWVRLRVTATWRGPEHTAALEPGVSRTHTLTHTEERDRRMLSGCAYSKLSVPVCRPTWSVSQSQNLILGFGP